MDVHTSRSRTRSTTMPHKPMNPNAQKEEGNRRFSAHYRKQTSTFNPPRSRRSSRSPRSPPHHRARADHNPQTSPASTTTILPRCRSTYMQLYAYGSWKKVSRDTSRSTTETPVKIEEKKETVVALVDHDLEINLMSTDFYKKGRWPYQSFSI